MLPDPLDLYTDVPDGTGAGHQPFALIQQLPTGTVRRNLSASVGSPDVVKISHSTVGKGNGARDRHLVRMECAHDLGSSVPDPVNRGAVYLVADFPRVLSESEKENLFVDFLGLLRGVDASGTFPDMDNFFRRFYGGES